MDRGSVSFEMPSRPTDFREDALGVWGAVSDAACTTRTAVLSPREYLAEENPFMIGPPQIKFNGRYSVSDGNKSLHCQRFRTVQKVMMMML